LAAIVELPLGRNPIARLQLTAIQRSLQVQVNLVVQRDGTKLQPVVGQLAVEPRGCGLPEC